VAASGEDTTTGSRLDAVGSDAAAVTAAAVAAAVVLSVVVSSAGGVVEAAEAAVRWTTPGTAANVCCSCVTSDMSTSAAEAAVAHSGGRPLATPRLELLAEVLGVVEVDGVSTAQ